MHDRRHFLSQLFGGAAAAAVLPPLAWKPTTTGGGFAQTLHAHWRARGADEAYWQLVKDQFPLRPDLILMNAANLCPAPYPVIDTVVQLTRDIDADASFQNRAKLGSLREEARSLLAEYLGADVSEIAIVRNTSEANNTVINGLPLGAGDEVVVWDQNHPTNNIAWDVRAERYGYSVTRISTPEPPTDGSQVTEAFTRAVTPHTRVLAFSHVSNATGVGIPAKSLCTFARQRGILTLIDGAQTFGAVPVDLHDLGCDFYTGSAHKWFVGPKEAGVLYVRRERVADLWPTHVGVGWVNALERGAAKFDNLGQRDDAAVVAVGTAARFHNTIGSEHVGERVRALATRMKQGLRDQLPGVTFRTPLDPELSAGVVVFQAPGLDAREAYGVLYRDFNIGCARRGAGLRFCPHIYNTAAEVDRVIEVVSGLQTS